MDRSFVSVQMSFISMILTFILNSTQVPQLTLATNGHGLHSSSPTRTRTHHAIHDADDPLGYETAPPDVQLHPERVKAMMAYNAALKAS